LFPESIAPKVSEGEASSDDIMAHVKSSLNVKFDKMKPFTPFFIDDYIFLLNKVKEQPLLTRWSERDRENISRWILDALAIRDVLESNSTPKIQAYLDDLRAYFFPMIRYPSLTNDFVIPSVADMKALLYNNDIGYKTQNGKVFVRRYYLLPRLLFPNETFATSIIKDEEKVKQLIADHNMLQSEINSHGITNVSLPIVEQRLKEFYKRTFSNKPLAAPTIDFSSLEALLYGDTSGASSTSSASAGAGQASAPSTPSLVEDKAEVMKRKIENLKRDVENNQVKSAGAESANSDNQSLNAYERDTADLMKALNSSSSSMLSKRGNKGIEVDELFRANIRKKYEEKEARRMQRLNAHRNVEPLPVPDILSQ
jgi:hypothetical protein